MVIFVAYSLLLSSAFSFMVVHSSRLILNSYLAMIYQKKCHIILDIILDWYDGVAVISLINYIFKISHWKTEDAELIIRREY